MDKEESFGDSTCEDQINMAERELSAFILAVTELSGPEQARLSGEDWLDESEQIDSPQRATSRDWRMVTVAALARLATRGAPPRDHRTLCNIDRCEGFADTIVQWSRMRASGLMPYRSRCRARLPLGTPVEIRGFSEC
jgi:hypothetical protein